MFCVAWLSRRHSLGGLFFYFSPIDHCSQLASFEIDEGTSSYSDDPKPLTQHNPVCAFNMLRLIVEMTIQIFKSRTCNLHTNPSPPLTQCFRYPSPSLQDVGLDPNNTSHPVRALVFVCTTHQSPSTYNHHSLRSPPLVLWKHSFIPHQSFS